MKSISLPDFSFSNAIEPTREDARRLISRYTAVSSALVRPSLVAGASAHSKPGSSRVHLGSRQADLLCGMSELVHLMKQMRVFEASMMAEMVARPGE